MMQNTGKTSNFLKAINKYAAEQRKEIKTQAEEFRKYELQKAEAEVLRDAYFLIQKEMAQMKKGISSEVSKMEMEKRKELFAKRQSIMNEVFKKAEDKLFEFTGTQAYKELLKKYVSSISKVLKKQGTILYICKRDENMVDEIKQAYGKLCEVQVSDDIKIGGVMAVNENMSMIVDETIDAKLNDQKEWFAEKGNSAGNGICNDSITCSMRQQ